MSESEVQTAINEIDELIRKRTMLLEEVNDIDKQLVVAKCRLLEEETGFKAGDKIITSAGETGILSFDSRYSEIWCWRKLGKTGKVSGPIRVLSGDFKKVE